MEDIQKPVMKKTLGKRAIPIRKIEKKQNRHVCFSKRREGLFKKARELSTLCGSEIAVIVFSEAGNAFTSGHPSAESVIQRYVLGSTSRSSFPAQSATSFCNNEEAIQWENRVGTMGLNELQSYANQLQKVRDFVAVKAASMDSPFVAVGNQKSSSDHSTLVSPDSSDDQHIMQFGDGALSTAGYLHSNEQPSSSSSPCFGVDTQFVKSPCDISDGAQNAAGDLHSDVLQPSSSSSPCFEVETLFDNSPCDISDGALNAAGFLHSDVLLSSPSSPWFEVDTLFDNSPCDISDGALNAAGDLHSDVLLPSSPSSPWFEVDSLFDNSPCDISDGALNAAGYLHSDVLLPSTSSPWFEVDTLFENSPCDIRDGALDDGYLQSDVLPTSFQVDAQCYTSLCDIEWEEEDSFDMFAASQQRQQRFNGDYV